MHRLALLLTIPVALTCLVPARAAAQSALAGCRASQWQGQTAERSGGNESKFDGTPSAPVQVDCDDQQFFADHIELYKAEGLVKANGNIVYVQGRNRIVAERMEFNTKTRTGVFYVASGTAVVRERPEPGLFGTQEPDMMFRGDEIHKLGPKKYKIVRGAFTTCVQPTPRWELVSGQVTVVLDDHVWMTNSLFKVKDVPLMYLPAFYYPIEEDNRSTGFLLPVYGSSTVKGKSLSNAFFWAISRSQDATFYHDWFSQAGQQYGGEYEYVAAPGSQGRTTISTLDQKQSDPGDDVQLPALRSYQVNGSMNHRLPRGFQARATVDYFTSITTKQLYQQDVYQATNSQRRFQGNLAGTWNAYSISATGERTDYFTTDGSFQTTGSLPRVNVNRGERPIGRSPVYFGVNGEFVSIVRSTTDGTTKLKTNDQGLSRADVLPTVRVPFNKLPFLSINTAASYRATYWTESLEVTPQAATQVPEPIGRNYFEVQSRLTGPVFTRIFNTPGNGYAEKFKHVIEPGFLVTWRTAANRVFEIPLLEGPDYIYAQGGFTSFGYGLTSRLYAKKGTSREILSASLAQSYYTTLTAAERDPRFQSSTYSTVVAPNHFSPLVLSVRGAPTDRLQADFRTEFDSHTNQIRTLAANGGVNGSWGSANGGWSRRRFLPDVRGFEEPLANNYLNANTTIRRAGGRVGITYSFNYDLRNDFFLQQRYQGFYNAQCCGIGLEYQTFNYQGSSIGAIIPRDRRFNLSFTLAGIGTFSNLLGAFGANQGR